MPPQIDQAGPGLDLLCWYSSVATHALRVAGIDMVGLGACGWLESIVGVALTEAQTVALVVVVLVVVLTPRVVVAPGSGTWLRDGSFAPP